MTRELPILDVRNKRVYHIKNKDPPQSDRKQKKR